MTDTRDQLKAMMKRYRLNRQQVADLLHVHPTTVDAWLKPATSKSSSPVPVWRLELLQYKCARPPRRD